MHRMYGFVQRQNALVYRVLLFAVYVLPAVFGVAV